VRINTAVAAANKAQKTAETAKTELVSRSQVVGELLLEAKKLHPAVKDFMAFLKRVDGLKRSRAYDMMCVAGGQKTVEEIRRLPATVSGSTGLAGCYRGQSPNQSQKFPLHRPL
jgi:hypothetical protein